MTRSHIFNGAGLATDPAGRERWWDPSDPRIFVPRAIGIGWDINFGAIAVKLGWIREDDLDDDVIAAIPHRYRKVAETAVVASAGLAFGALATTSVAQNAARQTRRPSERNSNLLARPGRGKRSNHLARFTSGLGVVAVTAFAATRTQPADRLVTGAIATGVNTAVGLDALESVTSSAAGRGLLKTGQALALLGLPLGIVTAGIRRGLANVVEKSQT